MRVIADDIITNVAGHELVMPNSGAIGEALFTRNLPGLIVCIHCTKCGYSVLATASASVVRDPETETLYFDTGYYKVTLARQDTYRGYINLNYKVSEECAA